VRVLLPLPATDFDPTESAVPWKLLARAGHTVVFATPAGERAAADDRLLSGRGFGPLRRVLMARVDAIDLYREMERDPAFLSPLGYEALEDFDAIVLPGGHAPGMKTYLESEALQRVVARHLEAERPLGAICHGVLVAARARDRSGTSVLAGRRTTALTRALEMMAWNMTRAWLGDYYRTYPEPVQDEVERAVGGADLFVEGPPGLAAWHARLGLRDAPDKLGRGFFVRDGCYLSARWPGDAYAFATELCRMLA
jgi:protease I